MSTADAPDLRWEAIDRLYAAQAQGAPPDRRWLLVQTLASVGPRRALLRSLPLGGGGRVLDMGCGFAASTLEISALAATTVVGVDLDRPVLGQAQAVLVEASATGVVHPTSSAHLAAGDAYRLPFPDGSFNAVFSRFVFQHLSDPARAAAEIHRVLAPGGWACVVDVDDGLSISEPPPSSAFERLAGALRASQAAAGGDRRIGRRLAALLDQAGLTPNPILVLPQAAYHVPEPGDVERALMLERLRAAREGIVGGEHLTATEFDRDLAALASEQPGPTCEIEAHLAVVATKRS